LRNGFVLVTPLVEVFEVVQVAMWDAAVVLQLADDDATRNADVTREPHHSFLVGCQA
jgi:hypothetical protein